MRLLATVAVGALLLAPAAAASRIHATETSGAITITARMAAAGSYAASCTLGSWNVGSGDTASKPNGKLVLQVLLAPGVSGAFSCWVRDGGTDWTAPAALLKGGRPAQVTGP